MLTDVWSYRVSVVLIVLVMYCLRPDSWCPQGCEVVTCYWAGTGTWTSL